MRQYIQGRSVPCYTGTRIIKQVSSAVAFLHDHSILHRDIKPGNILVKHQQLVVGQELMVALSDFGCSRQIGTEEQMTPRMATLYYRAPEILLGQTYGRSSDVWSTGITFVEVEQGHPPFQIETEFQLLHEITQTVGGRVKNLDLCTTSVKQSACKWGKTYGVEFKALVDNMLAFDPLHRISSRAAARRSQVWWRCSRC